MIDLNATIANVKGKPVPLVESVTIPNGKLLTAEARTAIELALNAIEDETLKRDVFGFFKDYVVKTELVSRDMCVRDVFQTLITSIEKPEGSDMVRYTKLLPRLDDDCAELNATEKEIDWLVRKLIAADEKVIGALIKGRVLNILDPDGELVVKYGTDT